MTNYSKSEYGKNPWAGTSNNAGRAKWGGGWPNCSGAKTTVTGPSGAKVTARKELAPLVSVLLQITHEEGYVLRKADTGGFACRPIAVTRIASNHSYAIAFDLNWTENPYSLIFKSKIPPAVVHAWEEAGFYWGGRYSVRKDTMHFEAVIGPSEVPKYLKIAKARLASLKGPVTPTPKPPVVTPPAPKPAAGRKLGSRTLKVGNTGADVAVLQRFLGIEDDGRFGPITEEAVKRYQRIRHIKADGIAGKVTVGPIVKIVYGK